MYLCNLPGAHYIIFTLNLVDEDNMHTPVNVPYATRQHAAFRMGDPLKIHGDLSPTIQYMQPAGDVFGGVHVTESDIGSAEPPSFRGQGLTEQQKKRLGFRSQSRAAELLC